MKTCFFISQLILLFLFVSLGISSNLLLEHPILKADKKEIVKLQNIKPKNNTLIFDNNNKIISEQFEKYQIYTKYEDIPLTIKDTIIAIEDRNFFDHPGVDIFGILRAALSYLKDSKSNGYRQGASTITQQVVKNFLLSNEKTIQRKVKEIILSLYLEQVLSKEKIFEIYTNHIFLGQGSYGVAAAARRYFNKTLDEINYAEAAFIAGLFQSPSRYNPYTNLTLAKERQRLVLEALKEHKNLTKTEISQYITSSLKFNKYESLHGKIAPYYVDYIQQEAGKILEEKGINLKDSGLRIYTNLSINIQNAIESTYTESKDLFKLMDSHQKDLAEDKDKSQAAILVMDRRSGKILGMKGGNNFNQTQFNRAINSKRAPGSVFKTITYALALNNGHQWNDQHYVSPITIGNYRPRSSYYRLYSQTTLLKAFYESINSPAVTIGNELGIENVIKFAKKLGVETPLKKEAATLLGSSEVSMLDMARVYSVFANQGEKVNPYGITRIENETGKLIYEATPLKKRVIKQETAELISEGLKQVLARGTGYKARFLTHFAAGKTGTSNESKDNWFCGFTDDLVIITWMGHDQQKPYSNYISASNTATKLWATVAQKTKKILGTKQLSLPKKVKVAKINPKYGHLDENGIPMYFISELFPEKKYSDLIQLDQGKNIRMDFNDF